MGTRSLTHIIDNEWGNNTHLLTIYRQFDGYPEGHGDDLARFITSRRFVNGISPGDEHTVFNGADCFAASLVTHLKTMHGVFTSEKIEIPAGGVYIRPPDLDAREEFNYTITIEKDKVHFKVTDYDDNVIYRGNPNGFLLEQRENR